MSEQSLVYSIGSIFGLIMGLFTAFVFYSSIIEHFISDSRLKKNPIYSLFSAIACIFLYVYMAKEFAANYDHLVSFNSSLSSNDLSLNAIRGGALYGIAFGFTAFEMRHIVLSLLFLISSLFRKMFPKLFKKEGELL